MKSMTPASSRARLRTAAVAGLLTLAGAPAWAQNTDTPPASPSNTPPPPSTTGPQSPTPPAVQSQPGAPPASEKPVPKPNSWFEAHGSFFERYRDDTNHDNGGYDSRDSVTYGNVIADVNPSPLYTFYVRVGGEGLTPRGQGRDFNTSYYQGDAGFRGALAIDQLGAIYHDAGRGLVVTLGRQDQPLDATGTAYDQSFKVGRHTFLDGVSVVQKIGKGTAEGYAFSEDQYRLLDGAGRSTRNGLYALRGTYRPSGDITLGALVARFISSGVNQAVGVQTTSNFEGDVSLQAAPNLLFKAEYGRSDAHSRNDLYYGLVKYGITSHDSFTVYTYKIATNADVGQDSGYPNSSRGTRYFIEHDFDVRTSLIVYHETDRQLYASGKSDSDQLTLVYTF